MHNRWRHTHKNPPRKHFPPDRQGTPRTDNRPVVGSQQRYRRHKSAAPACSGCGGPPHDDRRMCKAWNRVCYKCQKLNHFANVCKPNIQQIHLVENDTHSQSSDTLCDDAYTLGLYHTSATHTIPPYIQCRIYSVADVAYRCRRVKTMNVHLVFFELGSIMIPQPCPQLPAKARMPK